MESKIKKELLHTIEVCKKVHIKVKELKDAPSGLKKCILLLKNSESALRANSSTIELTKKMDNPELFFIDFKDVLEESEYNKMIKEAKIHIFMMRKVGICKTLQELLDRQKRIYQSIENTQKLCIEIEAMILTVETESANIIPDIDVLTATLSIAQVITKENRTEKEMIEIIEKLNTVSDIVNTDIVNNLCSLLESKIVNFTEKIDNLIIQSPPPSPPSPSVLNDNVI